MQYIACGWFLLYWRLQYLYIGTHLFFLTRQAKLFKTGTLSELESTYIDLGYGIMPGLGLPTAIYDHFPSSLIIFLSTNVRKNGQKYTITFPKSQDDILNLVFIRQRKANNFGVGRNPKLFFFFFFAFWLKYYDYELVLANWFCDHGSKVHLIVILQHQGCRPKCESSIYAITE